MLDYLLTILVAVSVAILVSLPVSLLLIALLRGEPIPWRAYLAYFLGKR